MKKITLILISLFATVAFAQWTEPEIVSPLLPSGPQQPWVSNDGERLYLSNNTDIFVATRNDSGLWANPTSLPNHINSIGDVRSPCESPTGDTLYFTSWNWSDPGGFDVFFCVQTDTGWGPVQELGPPVSTPGSHELSVGISRDGTILLIARTRLYYHLRQEDGNWGEAIDFGDSINIPGEEDKHSCLSPDNNRLFFYRLYDHFGDIWESKKIDGVWRRAERLPFPINDVQTREQDPCMLADGRTLYYRKEVDGIHRIYQIIDTTVISDIEPSIPRSQQYPPQLLTLSYGQSRVKLMINTNPGNFSVHVYDILGREIKNERIEFSRTLNGASGTLSLPVLPIGIYIVSVQTKESLFAAKYLIIH